MTHPCAVRRLLDQFQVFTVLEDGTTYSGTENTQIMVYPADEHCTEDQHNDLENGILPETGDLATVNLRRLLNEAMEANLPCVAELVKLIGK